jgi:hypothetical protein
VLILKLITCLSIREQRLPIKCDKLLGMSERLQLPCGVQNAINGPEYTRPVDGGSYDEYVLALFHEAVKAMLWARQCITVEFVSEGEK